MVALRILLALLPFGLFGQNVFEDRFPDDQAGPIGASRDARPGGQGITYIQRDGNLSISNGSLVVPVQGTPATGDLSYYAAQTTAYLGLTLLFKVIPTTLAFQTGVQPGAMLGFSDNGDPITGFDVWGTAGFGISGSGARVRVWPFFCPSVATDEEDFRGIDTLVVNSTYSVAIVMGGYSTELAEYGVGVHPDLWYSGQTESGFPHGQTFFVKKDNGNWLRQAMFNGCAGVVEIPAITNYNSAFTVSDFVLSRKVSPDLIQPLHYVKGNASNGTQLFDITPQVGAAYDSVYGNFTVTSNLISPTGSDPHATVHWLTKVNMGVSDVYAEAKVQSIPSGFSFVFRYKESDKSHIIVQVGSSANIRMWSYNGTSYSEIGSAVSYQHAYPTHPVLRAACIGDKIYAWLYDQQNPDDEVVKVETSTFNQTETRHGVRCFTASNTFSFLRFWKSGGGGEYNQILNDYMAATNLTRRGGQ